MESKYIISTVLNFFYFISFIIVTCIHTIGNNVRYDKCSTPSPLGLICHFDYKKENKNYVCS